MNPHPASLVVDLFALALTLAAGTAACWIATLVWYYFALRADSKRRLRASFLHQMVSRPASRR